jgi:hypothetical protein
MLSTSVVGLPGNMFAYMPGDDTGIGVKTTSRRETDDQANRFSLVECFLRRSGLNRRNEREGKAYHKPRTPSGPRHNDLLM